MTEDYLLKNSIDNLTIIIEINKSLCYHQSRKECALPLFAWLFERYTLMICRVKIFKERLCHGKFADFVETACR